MKLNSKSIFILLGIILLSYGVLKYINKPIVVDKSSSKKTSENKKEESSPETTPKEAGMGGGFPGLGFGMIVIMFGLFFLFLGTSKRISLWTVNN